MAIINTPDYKTGKNWAVRLGNALSYIPGAFGAGSALVFGAIGTGIDSLKWLFRGKLKSALTVLVTGSAATAVNATGALWGGNLASGILTGKTLGSNVRTATEWGTGAVLGVVGGKPQVLQSNIAGIGSVGGGAGQDAPGRWVSQVAASRGEDPNVAYARLQSGQPDHIAALQAAQAGYGSRGIS